MFPVSFKDRTTGEPLLVARRTDRRLLRALKTHSWGSPRVVRLERHEAPADEIPIFVISEEPKRKYNATYSGADIARMHDDLQNYRKAFVKGLRIEVKQTPQGRRPYDRFELYIDGRNVWSGEAKYIDPLNIAGGTFEAFVLQALADAKVRRT